MLLDKQLSNLPCAGEYAREEPEDLQGCEGLR